MSVQDELGGRPADPALEALRAEFGRLLPGNVRARVHPTAVIDGALKRAVDNGWTVRELAEECSRDLGTASNVGAIITSRLGNAANTVKRQPTKPLATWCGQCADDRFRWEVDAEDRPVRPCPRCSPGAN